MTKLTKRYVDSLKAKDKDYFVWDDEVSGFGMRIFNTGRKSYLIQYRSAGRTRRMTIGKHGVLTPDQARKQAQSLLVDATQGGNPSEEKRLYREAPTLKEFCEFFIKHYCDGRIRESTLKEYKRAIDIFILPALGTHKVQDITRQDISRLHLAHVERPYQANRTKGVLSRIFNVAEERGLRPDNSNPTYKVKKYPENKRDVFLTGEQLTKLGETLVECEEDGTESPYMIAALRLLILTGCRLGEIQTMKWEYIQGNALMLPDSKTGKKKVYLGKAALEILSNDIERKEDNPYVICGKLEGAFITDFQKPWRRIRKRAGIEDIRIHDLRHTFASHAVSTGETLHMTGKLIGHSQPQSTARYAHLADAPMHEAADRVSEGIAKSLFGGNND